MSIVKGGNKQYFNLKNFNRKSEPCKLQGKYLKKINYLYSLKDSVAFSMYVINKNHYDQVILIVSYKSMNTSHIFY